MGVLVALTMPRGPATAVQALIVMASSLAVGVVAGLLMRSRWAMLLAPLAYIAAVELARLNAVGPTVDMIRLDNTFGILGFILGRGFHGLVGLLPMILGVEVGVLAARHLRRHNRFRQSDENDSQVDTNGRSHPPSPGLSHPHPPARQHPAHPRRRRGTAARQHRRTDHHQRGRQSAGAS